MAFCNGKGNSVSFGSDGIAIMLPGADIVVFGSRNGYYSYGHVVTDSVSILYRLWKEFGINSPTNKAVNGAQRAIWGAVLITL